MANIREVKGIPAALADKLKAKGLGDTDAFLAAVKTAEMRKNLAKELGIEHGALLESANRADLHRVKGIGEVFSDLLENAGVDTVKELAGRVPENLLAKMVAVNEEKKLAQRLPTLADVKNWVEQAKALPRALEY